MDCQRTIISAMHPRRYRDSFTEIIMWVWFEELDGPLPVCATPFDCERHSKELWIRAMAGEYGPIEVMPESPPMLSLAQQQRKLITVQSSPRLLSHDRHD